MNMKKQNKELLNYLDSLIEYASGRLSQINNKINGTNNIKLHTILQLGLAMNYYVKNIRISLESDNILAGNVLLRSLIEGFINIEYIMQDNTPLRAIAYLFQDFKTREKNVNTYKEIIEEDSSKSNIIPELSTPEKCDKYKLKLEDEKKNIINILKNDHNIEVKNEDLNFFTLSDRADRANLRGLYKILYPYLCGLSHMSMSGLKDLMTFESGKYLFKKKDNDIELNKILGTAFRIYLVSIEDLFKEFNIYIEEDFIHLREITKQFE